MKNIICMIFCFAFFESEIAAQEIYIENGVSISSVTKSNYETSYQMSIGLNFLQKKRYFLSACIGYIGKGETIYYENEGGRFSNKYITASFLFNLTKKINNYALYIGAGPRYDIRIKTNYIPENLDFAESNLFGFRVNTGFMYFIGNYFIGLNISYLPSFTDYTINSEIRDKTLTVGGKLGINF